MSRTRILLCVLLCMSFFAIVQAGCGGWHFPDFGLNSGGGGGGKPLTPPSGPADRFQVALFWICIPIAGVCVAAGVVGLIASALGLPTRKAGFAALGCGLGLAVAYYLVDQFAKPFVWIVGIGSLVAGVGCAIPFVIHYFKWAQSRSGVDFTFDGIDPPPGPQGGVTGVPVGPSPAGPGPDGP